MSAGVSIVPGTSSPRAIGVAVARVSPWSAVVWTTASDQPPSPSLLTARTCTAYSVLSLSPETTYESEPEVHTSSSTVQLVLVVGGVALGVLQVVGGDRRPAVGGGRAPGDGQRAPDGGGRQVGREAGGRPAVCALTLVASSIESAAQAASRASRLIGGPLPAASGARRALRPPGRRGCGPVWTRAAPAYQCLRDQPSRS